VAVVAQRVPVPPVGDAGIGHDGAALYELETIKRKKKKKKKKKEDSSFGVMEDEMVQYVEEGAGWGWAVCSLRCIPSFPSLPTHRACLALVLPHKHLGPAVLLIGVTL
jgi:hypothetical protein